MDIGFLRTFQNDVYYVKAQDSSGKTLSIDSDVNQTSGFYFFRVNFASPLASNRTYQFTVNYVLGHLIQAVSNGLLYNFSAAPVLTQDAVEANVTLLGAVGSNFASEPNSTYKVATIHGYPALTKQYKPWRAYSSETFIGPYLTVTQYVVDVKSVERDIIIRRSGTLSVKDSYALHNYASPITGITITLPDGATNVMAYDVVGAMWATPQYPTAPYQVTVAPRYGEGIRGTEDFNFSLTYDLPTTEYIKQVNWWGDYNLTMPMANNHDDFVFDTAIVKIITPTGLEISNVVLPPQTSILPPAQYDPTTKQIALGGVTDSNNVTMSMSFNYSSFWSALGYMPWLVAFEAVLAVALVVNRYRRGPEVAVPVPVEKLREFVGLYDERISLTRELVRMEEDVARGSLVKHEFRRRKKVMDLRLDDINRSLRQVKEEIRQISQYYDELIRRVDRAEAEIEASRASLNQVRAQYRSGKSTRETYDAMVNDLTKRIDRAEQTVETILITLREEAR
jgi:prefoldin subunit 5